MSALMMWLIYTGPTLAVLVVVLGIAFGVSRSSFSRVAIGAAICGLVGFIAGFVGPALLSSSPQGPLFGIFISGPVGVVVGAILGRFGGFHTS